jgi:hypothetical protein
MEFEEVQPVDGFTTPEHVEKKADEKPAGPVEAVKVGSQVLFVLDNSTVPGVVRPAVVTNVDLEDKSGLSRVDLQVFTAGDKDYHPTFFHASSPQYRYDVCYNPEKVANSWHWLEK